jgi:hypothetical protein
MQTGKWCYGDVPFFLLLNFNLIPEFLLLGMGICIFENNENHSTFRRHFHD